MATRICDECKGSGTLVNHNERTAPNAASFSDKFGGTFGNLSGGQTSCPSCLGTGIINCFGV